MKSRYWKCGVHSFAGAAMCLAVLLAMPGVALAKDTLVIGIPADVESMDPHLSGGLSMRVWANIYETLLSREPDGSLKPRLAESWSQIGDTTYEFKIREGVKFTTGRPLDAEAIAKCFRVKNDDSSPHAHISFSRWIKDARATDPRTLVIETDGPFPPAILYLAGVMPAEVYDVEEREKLGDLKTRSAGSGPFLLDEVRPGEYVQLKRNMDYWGGAPAIETLRFKVIPEETTRLLALERGEIDMTLDLGPASFEKLQSSGNVDVSKYRAWRLNTLEFNFLQPIIKENPEVRRAIMLAIDTKAITENIIGPMGDPADSVVLDVTPAHVSVPGFLRYDPGAATQLLEEAGWKLEDDGTRAKDGQRLDLVLITDFTRDYRNREVAQAIQAYLKDVGINLDLKLVERGPFIDAVVQKGEGFDLAIQGWGSPTNEPSWWIYTRLHSENQALGAWGTSRTRLDWLDKEIDDARFDVNPESAAKKWKSLQHEIYDEALMQPLYFSNKIQALRKEVSNFVTHSDEWYGYRYEETAVGD